MARNTDEIITNPNWWKRRSLFERLLIIFLIIAVIAISCVTYFLVTHLSPSQRTIEPNGTPNATTVTDKSVCITQDCVHSAASLLSKLDSSVDPCHDFYDFACGGFIKSTVIPEDKSSVNMFSEIEDSLANQLNGLLSNDSAENDTKYSTLAKYMYQSCVVTTEIERTAHELARNISRDLGGWPVLGQGWNESWTWEDIAHQGYRMGFQANYIVTFSVASDWTNSSKRILDIDEPRLGLIQEYLSQGLNKSHVESYLTYMIEVAEVLGANRSVAEEQMKEALDFEVELSKNFLLRSERRNLSVILNRFTLDELQSRFNYTDWRSYLNEILPKTIQIDGNETLSVTSLVYLDKLADILQKTPKRTIANYFLWRTIENSIPYLSKDLREKQLDHKRRTTGQQSEEPRWRECTDIVNNKLSAAVGSMYIRTFFHKNSKTEALDMVGNIRNEFRETLLQISWMDNETRAEALKKLEGMDTLIGYPDELMDDSKLEWLYKDLNITDAPFLQNVLEIQKYFADFEFNRVRQFLNKTDWIDHAKPADVNAYYSGIENNIQFPAGILQGVFFDVRRPKFMNYGAMGLVIGHEITHGYDDTGREFDVNGNHVDWWKKDAKEAFLEKANCIREQYESYIEPTINTSLNGVNTQGENIADNGGVKVSYHAYKSWIARNGDELRLPGLNFTSEQMFWLSAAQSWCSVYTPETLKSKIITEYHSPERFRIIGSFSNSEEFAKDFQCKEGSPMNPVKKCKVW